MPCCNVILRRRERTLTCLPSPPLSPRHPAYTHAPSRMPHHRTRGTRTAPQSPPGMRVDPAESSHLLPPASHRNTPHAASVSARIRGPPHIPLLAELTPMPLT